MKTTILKYRRMVSPRRIAIRPLVQHRHGPAIVRILSPAHSRVHERLETGVFQCELREHCGGCPLGLHWASAISEANVDDDSPIHRPLSSHGERSAP